MEEDEKKSLVSKLKNKEVTIFVKKKSREDLISFDGTIVDVNPNIEIGIRSDVSGFLVFGGYIEGIYQIINKKKKVIYENQCVLEEYNLNKQKTKEDLERIRNQGVWHLENIE